MSTAPEHRFVVSKEAAKTPIRLLIWAASPTFIVASTCRLPSPLASRGHLQSDLQANLQAVVREHIATDLLRWVQSLRVRPRGVESSLLALHASLRFAICATERLCSSQSPPACHVFPLDSNANAMPPQISSLAWRNYGLE